MRWVIVLALIGCGEGQIDACGRACFQSGSRMVSFSPADGCKCANTELDGGCK